MLPRFLRTRFKIEKTLRRSPTTISFLAHDRWSGKDGILVKCLRAGTFTPHRGFQERLAWYRGFRHPRHRGISYAGFTPKGDFYVVRDYFNGEGWPTIRPRVGLVDDLIAACALMHSHRIVHGRIKPTNILVTQGSVLIVDGGLPATNPDRLEVPSMQYTAPEVLLGGEATPEADLYSLGVVLYQGFSGRTPFNESDRSLLKQKLSNAVPPDLHDIVDDPGGLTQFVNQLLSKDPSERARAFSDMLKQQFVLKEPATRAPYVGHSTELARLLSLLQAHSDGVHVAVVDGNAGAGKTRLLQELRFRSELNGKTVLTGRSYDGDNRRFEPILQLIEHFFKRYNDELLEWLASDGSGYSQTLQHLLPEHTILSSSPTFNGPLSSAKLVADLVGSLIRLSNRIGATALVLEDAQWWDEGTAQVIEQLLLRAPDTALNLIITMRSNQAPALVRYCLSESSLPGLSVDRISLRPLSPNEALRMASALTQQEDRLNSIVSESDGNPLLVEEYALNRQGDGEAPTRGRNILLEKFRSLGSDLRRVAEALSLFPKPAPVSLVCQAVDAEANTTFDSLLRELVSAGIAEEFTGHFTLRHDWIRKSIYDSIGRGRRRRLHSALYEKLSPNSDDEFIAYHAAHAGMPRMAIEAYERLATRSQISGDYRSGAEFLSSARRLYNQTMGTVPPQIDIVYSACLAHAGRPRRGRQVLKRLNSAGLTDQTLIARLYLTLGACYRDSPARYVAYLEEAVRHLSKEAPDLPGTLLRLSHAYGFAGRVAEAVATLRRFDELSHDESHPDYVWYQDLKAGVLIALDQHAEALALMAVDHQEETFLPHVLSNRGVCLENLGNFADALQCHERALRLSRQRGLLHGEGICLQNIGFCCQLIGEFDRSEECFSEAERLYQRINFCREGDYSDFPILTGDHAILQLERGDYAAAQRSIASSSQWLKGQTTSLAAVLRGLKAADVYSRTAQFDKSNRILAKLRTAELLRTEFLRVEHTLVRHQLDSSAPHDTRLEGLKTALKLTESLGTLPQRCRVLIALSEAHLARQERKHARSRLKEANRITRRCGFGLHRPRIALLKARATSAKRIQLRYLKAAHRMAHRLPLPEVEAEAGFRIATNLLSNGSLVDAYRVLKESVAIIQRLSAQIPTRSRKRYLNVVWRKEARDMLERIRKPAEAELDREAADRRQSDTYFKAIYELATALAEVTSVESLVGVLRQTVARVSKRAFVLHLTTGGKDEFVSRKLEVTTQVSGRISRLYKRFHNQPFFGDYELRPASGISPELIGWIPFARQQTQFGGLYIELSGRPLTEREMDLMVALGAIVSNALAAIVGTPQVRSSPAAVKTRYSGIIGSSREIARVCELIGIASESAATVLIEGESGTGKELVARAIHENSSRSKEPLVTVDCGAIPESLIESELFGSRKGSFTGATSDRRGLFESADKGTLFLDEISNTSPSLQVKLLRVLQEREVRRIGDTTGRSVDVRLIAATNANLEALVRKGAFRQDLLYRLKVLHIEVPPLRRRREDIPEIARNLLDRLNSTHKTRKRFGRHAIEQLMSGDFRGNVRELQNVVERAYFLTTEGAIIDEIAVDKRASGVPDKTEVLTWFEDLKCGREDFWSSVHTRYKKRDISRETVMALMDVGLRATRGSYKSLAALLHVKDSEYRRFMDFLRRNKCQPDFRPYRRLPVN